jgi:hypothetical protein
MGFCCYRPETELEEAVSLAMLELVPDAILINAVITAISSPDCSKNPLAKSK